MRNQIFAFFISMIPPYVAATTGVFFKPGDWYLGILKPAWTPPPLTFPVVWTILYFFMGITFYYLYRSKLLKAKEGAIYTLGLVLNALWSPLFFGAHLLWIGLAVIGCLWLVIAIFIFKIRKSKGIATLNALYLIWLSIAFALNLSIALNNGPIENPESYLDEQFEVHLQSNARKAFQSMSARTVITKTQDGYHRLKKEDLYRWNQLRIKMAKNHSQLCASLWTGGGNQSQMIESMNSFYRGDLRDWAKLSSKAFVAGWKLSPSGTFPEEEISKIFFDISLNLSKQEKEKFFNILKGADLVKNKDACWMLLTTLQWIDQKRSLESQKLLYFLAKKMSP